ncbi:hypothetical protein Gpo141_00006503 [Globisporangium polare]
MALQRKNFRCPREGAASPIHAAASAANGSAGVVISHAELPPRQRKRLQVGTTNLIKSTSEFVEDAPRHICATNIDLLKATLGSSNSSSNHHVKPSYEVTEGKSTGDLQVVRTEQRRLRSMTPSSSATRLEMATMRSIRTSNGARTALEHLDSSNAGSSDGGQHPDPRSPTTKDMDTPKTHQDSHARQQQKQQALFAKNRRRLYEAFVEKYGSMRAVFKAFDSDGDGVISFQRFHNMVEASEVGLTPEETRLMYTHVDTNGDNAMEFREFAQMFTASELSKDVAVGFRGDSDSDVARDPSSSYALKYRSPLELSPRSREKMKELRGKVTEQLAKQHGLDVSVHGGKNVQLLMFAFKQFDTDNDGVLTYEQAKRALGNEYLKLQMHTHELEEMVRMIDRNGDELISMKEFVQYFGVGKREIPTDLLDNGRKKALTALHQKMNASLTPREEFDPEYFEKRVFDHTESEVVESTGCLPESLSKRIAAAAIFQTPPSPVSPTRMLSGSKSVPTLGSLRGAERENGSKGRGPGVNPITAVSQDRFQHRRMERTDWTRVGLGGDGVLQDSGLFISDRDRFRTTTAEAFTPMRRGLNSGDLHRDQPPTSTIEFEGREQIRQARFERTQLQLELMDVNRAKEERLKDWKMRANVRKTAGQQFNYLDRIHDQEQRVAMKDLQMQKRHGGVRYLRMWAGSPDSQFNGAGGSSRGEGRVNL